MSNLGLERWESRAVAVEISRGMLWDPLYFAVLNTKLR